MMPMLAAASVSTTMTWNPSSDPSVTGYDIYYGTESHNYTNMVSAGNRDECYDCKLGGWHDLLFCRQIP